ncbi:MAG: RHS repeat protein, partial [Ignavibacteria bacterium]|nr:RHS repeat protein [Ignavibacteria bacterium]
MQVFAPSLLDSMGESTSTNQVSDVSQMFNERGFYKSNSFSFDDNEIINDFNGNLMYEIPMYSSKGAGGLDLDMKLVYNGSVNHEVILSDSAAFNGLNTPEPYKYNFNFPEWILSVNGIAVQVMNFETRLLSIPTDDIVGNSLKKLIPGYHYSDGMKSLTVSDRDRIFILAGDGSVISLVNITPGKYSGTYVSDSKGSHTKAQVIFDQTHNSGTYANDSTSKRRKLELFMGDGLIYSFTETRIDYWDMRNSTVPARRLAQPFILDGIRNRFGTSISFVYNNSYSPYGRPLLSNVYGVQITYAPNGMLFEDNMLGIGNYKFHFSDVLGYSEDLQGSKYPKLARITNPLSQQALISYGHIIRTLYNAPCNVNEISLNITLSDVYRIATFKNFLNGSREYTYLGPISMEIDYTPTISAYGVIRSDNQSGLYKGYGRDPFFTNMITQKIDKDNGIPKSKTEIDYSYDPAGSENPSIDTLDVYSTTREVTSLNDTTNNESVGITNSKEYKVYPVKNYGAIIEDFKDLSATTKLMKEQILKPGGVFEEVNYRYFIGGQSGGGQFNGSFLLENKIVTTEGYTRKWLYSYEHKGDEADSLIRKKTEIDPLLTKTETFFDNLETILTFYYNDKVLFNRPLAEYGQKLYYLNGIDTATRIYDKDNNLLKKAAKRIIKTTNNDSGYYGQLISERIYSEINSSSYLETKYTYYKRDTTGMAFHGNNVNHGDTSLIFIEGNPKQKLMPDGNEERYFYYPISFSESTIPVSSVPQVSFKVKYINGTITTEKEYFSDPRFPSRIDNYKRYGDGTCDSLKRMYYLYNPLGKPYYIVDENRFLTMFAYEPQYNRIKSITLPGDFSTSIAVDTTSRIDTNSYFDTLHINSSGWGHYDEMSDSLRFVNTPNHLRYGCNLFNMNIQYTGGPEDAIINTFQGAFFKIDGGLFPKIIDILDANLELNVLQNQYLINGEPANPEDYVTKLYPVDSIGSTGYRKCNIDYYYNLYFSHYFSFSGTSQDIYLDDSNPVDCYTENNYNVTDLLNGFIVNSGKTLNGFYLRTFDILPPHEYSVVFQSAFFINDINNCPYPVEWGQSKTPRLRIYARIDDTDTLKKVSTSGSTYIYDYDDIHRTVTVKALMRSYQPVQEKRIKYHFDGFGNIKQKDIYNSDFGFDSLLYKFNFLNLPSNTFDASQDQTKFSYDFAGRQKKTVNADASNSVQAYSYQTSIPVYMGGSTLNRFYIEKQEFTDETGRKFNKYFDDVGNLLREEKFVVGDDEIPERSEEPYNPDSLYQIEVFPTYISLNTDYKYDKLNRLMEVFTPQGKLIKYYYDEFGRQSQRITPDAGKTNYGYDKNGNLITSQDENQRVQSTEYLKFCTKRTYDGLNRLLTIGDVKIPVNEAPNEGTMGDTILPVFDYISVSSDSLYIINVYDTISSTQYGSVFSSLPAGYSAANYTRGRLVATAFRTYLGESWSYKYYRYNWRGNVTTFWQKLAGMDSMKVFEYYYNSQNQPLNMYYQSGRTDWKFYKNTYDDAGRLSEAGLQAFLGNTGNLVSDIQEAPVEEENIEDGPGGGSWSYKPYAQYRYNKDQQLDTMTINHSVTPYGIKHSYNNRNWLSDIRRAGGTLFFREEITYNPNGNIKYNKFTGTYKNSFGSTGDMRYNYTYDNSNRLVKADFDSLTTSFDNITSYDKDGNFQILKRYGSTNNLEDNFSYSYYSNTNKLQKVSGSNAQYIYDPNGNLKVDSLSHNYNMRY